MIKGPTYKDGRSKIDRRAWWSNKAEKYPFHAKSPTSVRPELVPGDHASVVLVTGWRTWGFTTIEERDRFVIQFGGHNI